MGSVTLGNGETVNLSDSSLYRPGDKLELKTLDGRQKGVYIVKSVTIATRLTIKKMTRWRSLLLALRHPILYLRFRRDPVGTYAARLFGIQKMP